MAWRRGGRRPLRQSDCACNRSMWSAEGHAFCRGAQDMQPLQRPARSPIKPGTCSLGGPPSAWSLPCIQVAPALGPRLCTTSTQLCTRQGRQRTPVPPQRASTCAVCPLGRVAAPGSLLRLVGQSCRPLTAAGTACGVLGLWGGHLSKPHMLPSLRGIDGHTQQQSAVLWARHLAAEPDAVRGCSVCSATSVEKLGRPARELAGRSAVPCACRYAGCTLSQALLQPGCPTGASASGCLAQELPGRHDRPRAAFCTAACRTQLGRA